MSLGVNYVITLTDRFDLSYLRKQVSMNEFDSMDSRFRGNDKLCCFAVNLNYGYSI